MYGYGKAAAPAKPKRKAKGRGRGMKGGKLAVSPRKRLAMGGKY